MGRVRGRSFILFKNNSIQSRVKLILRYFKYSAILESGNECKYFPVVAMLA